GQKPRCLWLAIDHGEFSFPNRPARERQAPPSAVGAAGPDPPCLHTGPHSGISAPGSLSGPRAAFYSSITILRYDCNRRTGIVRRFVTPCAGKRNRPGGGGRRQPAGGQE